MFCLFPRILHSERIKKSSKGNIFRELTVARIKILEIWTNQIPQRPKTVPPLCFPVALPTSTLHFGLYRAKEKAEVKFDSHVTIFRILINHHDESLFRENGMFTTYASFGMFYCIVEWITRIIRNKRKKIELDFTCNIVLDYRLG